MRSTSLRQSAIRSAAWSLPANVISRAIGLCGTLLLARYLTPNEYGVGLAAAVAVATASTVTTFGVGMYLVADPGMSRAATFHASCWFLATGVAAVALTMALGDPLGEWSGAQGFAGLLPVLIAAALVERVVYLPERILARQLQFRWVSVARTAGELSYTIVTVAVAALGGGAIAIAWGSLARAVARFACIVPAVSLAEWLEPHRLRLAIFRRIVGYGLTFTITSIATFGLRRWDNLLISRYFGTGVMGAYNYAYNLADTPSTAVGDQICDILAASFPRLDRERRAKALVHACTMIAMIVFPLSIGLAVVAATVVETFFDPRWSHVGSMLICLAALSAARPLASIFGAYCFTSGRHRTVAWLEWASLFGVVGAISSIGTTDVNWTCAGISAVFVLRTLAIMWLVTRQDPIQMSEFLRPMSRALAASLVMAAGVSAARPMLEGWVPHIRLLVEVALGAAIYIGSAWVVARSSCRELLDAMRSAFGRVSTDRTASRSEIAPSPRVLSVSSEFPNPSEPGKGLFVRARLEAIRSRAALLAIAPVAALDYANPERRLLASRQMVRRRQEGAINVLHPRWLYPPYGGWTNAFFLFLRLLPMVAILHLRRGFDVIDAHFGHPEGIAAVLLGRLLGRPVLVTIRGSELRYRHQRVKRFWMAWALRRADRVIAVSEGLRDLAIELGVEADRVKTIPNGINGAIFFPHDRVQCRCRWGIDPADRVILAAGDLAELKGHHRLIAAVKTLNDRGLNARLLIAGGVGRSGRYANTLRDQVSTNGLDARVTFLGEVTQEALAQLMSAADVFCLASSTEGWPNVVNEALACGTPVVATDVGAVRQLVVSQTVGSVVPLGDAKTLAEALGVALVSAWDREAIAAHGGSRSWERVAEEVLHEMRAVIAERSRSATRTAAVLPSRVVGIGRP